MTSSTFNDAIPQPTDQISQSQPQILTNFNQSNALYGADHIAWNAPASATRGRHKQVTFNAPLASDPNQVSPIASLYTKTVTNTELFYQNGNLSANIAQLTNLTPSAGNDGNGGPYNLFLTPWGLKLFMGRVNAFNGAKDFTLSGSVGFGSNVYTSLCSGYGGTKPESSITVSNGTNVFNITTSSNSAFNWLVITN